MWYFIHIILWRLVAPLYGGNGKVALTTMVMDNYGNLFTKGRLFMRRKNVGFCGRK